MFYWHKSEIYKLFTEIFRTSCPVSRISLCWKNFWTWLTALGPNGKCEIKKRGGFLVKETVAMAPRRKFFLYKKKTKWWTSKFFLKKFILFLYFYMAFLGINTERDLKKILRDAIAAEVLNKMRPRTFQSDWWISVKPVNRVQKFRFKINTFKVLIMDYLASQPASAVEYNWANFRNLSMKLSGNISEIPGRVCRVKGNGWWSGQYRWYYYRCTNRRLTVGTIYINRSSECRLQADDQAYIVAPIVGLLTSGRCSG